MQLRLYLNILARFWPVWLLLPLVAGGLSLALALRPAPSYQVTTRLLVTQAPLASSADGRGAEVLDGASWAASSFVLDDLPAVLSSTAFATDVAALLAQAGQPLEVAAIQAGLRPDVHHRAVTLVATAATPTAAEALATAAVESLAAGGLRFWGRAPAGGLHVAVLDPPGSPVALGGSAHIAREVALRTALALVAGIGLSFLAHYLDDRLRSPLQAEEWIGVRVLAVIPKE